MKIENRKPHRWSLSLFGQIESAMAADSCSTETLDSALGWSPLVKDRPGGFSVLGYTGCVLHYDEDSYWIIFNGVVSFIKRKVIKQEKTATANWSSGFWVLHGLMKFKRLLTSHMSKTPIQALHAISFPDLFLLAYPGKQLSYLIIPPLLLSSRFFNSLE